MDKFLLFLLLLVNFSYAKTYTLYLASTKYLDVAKKYYHDIRFHTPDFYDVVIRTHEKKNYSVIIRNIPTIEKTHRVERLLHAADKYQDSYIKAYKQNPSYNIIKIEKQTKIKKEPLYKQDVEDTNEYISASTMYNTGQYEKAYEMFYKLFLKNNYNKNINFFLAKSAYNTKKYDEATAAYERVLIIDPTFNQARYDYARILFKLKQKEEAKKEFEQLLKEDIKEDVKKDIEKFLDVLKKANKRKSGSAKIGIGFSRSSNVNGGLLEPIISDTLTGEEPVADSSAFQVLNINLFNYLENQPVRIKNSFLIYNKNHFNERDEDLLAFSYKPRIDYLDQKNKQIYGLELTADKVQRTIDEDFWVFAISPQIISKEYLAFLKYQRVMYDKKENEDKDFNKIEGFLKINLFKNMNVYTNIFKNTRVTDDRTDIDKYTLANGLNLFYEFNPANKINLNYQFDYSKYKYTNITFDNRRADRKHSIGLSYLYKITKSDTINLSSSYTKNYSNQALSEYDEKEITLSYFKDIQW